MRLSLVLSLALLGLAACASTQTVYQPAVGSDAVGYAETPIEHDRWRVTFHGGGADANRVGDLAIRRAAELTLTKGYDWFRVVDRHVDGAPLGGVRPDVSVGVGGADFNGGRGAGFSAGGGIGFSFPVGRDGEAVTVTLEVLMGHGGAPRDPDAYDARDVRRSFGPQA
jgi:hypothetical protein